MLSVSKMEANNSGELASTRIESLRVEPLWPRGVLGRGGGGGEADDTTGGRSFN